MSLQQWKALHAASGGDWGKPSGLRSLSSQRGSVILTTSSAPSIPVPRTRGGGLPKGRPLPLPLPSPCHPGLRRRLMHSYPGNPWSISCKKFSCWRGPYVMKSLLCLPSSDPRMHGQPEAKKWFCYYCSKNYFSQLDCQGHTLASHGSLWSPPLCACKTSTFNSAKAL